MDAELILEQLNRLEKIKHFTNALEIKYSADTSFSEQLSDAAKHLDKALLDLTFDLEKKINHNSAITTKLNLRSNIETATIVLKNIHNQSLNQDLQDLILFAESYENSSDLLISDNNNSLKSIKNKILLIITERFG